MKAALVALGLLALVAGRAGAAPPALVAGRAGAAPPEAARIDAAVQAAHAAGAFDGTVVVARAGQPLYGAGVGLADKAGGTQNGPTQLYRLASLTKQVTAVLVLQEVGRGRLALDAPVGRYLPGLPADTAKPTIRQLLQHVSGLPNPSDGPDDSVPPFYLRTGPDAGDNGKVARGFCAGPVKRPPGGPFEYDNCDYIVLGAALEAATGQRFAALVHERVARPLGLKSWGVFPGDPARQPKTAVGYGDKGEVELPQNPATYGASGALYGTAQDVARWDRALIDHRLLSPELTALMFTPDPKLYGEALGSWSYTLKFAGRDVRLWERQGDIGGTRLLNLIAPDEKLVVVLIANTAKADLFNTYSKQGLGYAVLKAAREP